MDVMGRTEVQLIQASKGFEAVAEDIGQISYSALHNLAYEQIIKAIRSGRYRPGDTLRTRTLAKALGVSSTPVREALSRLIAQNALEVDPRNRTAVIPPVTRELLEEMYDIRLLLECHAAELAAERATSRELSRLRSIGNRLAQREKDGQGGDAVHLDLSQEFFFAIYLAARQPLLVSLIDSLWLRSSAILSLLHRRQPADFTLAEGRAALLEALARRDPRDAHRAMTEVLVATREMVLRALSSDEDALLADSAIPSAKRKRSAQPGPAVLDAPPVVAEAKGKKQRARRKNDRRG